MLVILNVMMEVHNEVLEYQYLPILDVPRDALVWNRAMKSSWRN